MNVRDFGISVVRTLSPLVAGFVLTYLARLGITLDTDMAVMTTFALLSGLYYTAVRALETKYPIFGVFLGWKIQPEYAEVNHDTRL